VCFFVCAFGLVVVTVYAQTIVGASPAKPIYPQSPAEGMRWVARGGRPTARLRGTALWLACFAGMSWLYWTGADAIARLLAGPGGFADGLYWPILASATLVYACILFQHVCAALATRGILGRDVYGNWYRRYMRD